jgi:hypothetical protein
MEEIIAKSKMYKALKARQREEDEAEMNKVGDKGGGGGTAVQKLRLSNCGGGACSVLCSLLLPSIPKGTAPS